MFIKGYMRVAGSILFVLFSLTVFSQSTFIPDIKDDHANALTNIRFDFFSSDELLELTLYLNIREFMNSRSNPENMDGILTIKTSGTDSFSVSVKIKARGEMRRQYCSFPPIMLKFREDENNNLSFKGNLKLVTHCNPSDMYENLLFKEFVAYRLFNKVTPYSFRTRLARIQYIDPENPSRSRTAYAFVIENDKQMAQRNTSIVVENEKVLQKYMNESDMARVALFNYMIGNTDWSVMNQHNIKILQPLGSYTNQGIPVAYDFDYSGFVKAAYSAPSDLLPIRHVTERYYQGNCLASEELQSVLEEFENNKNAFFEIIRNFEYLPENTRKEMEYYIRGFYKVYRHPVFFMSEINRTCKRY